jgi:transposase
MAQPTTIKKYHVTLTDEQRSSLRELLSAGQAPARMLTRARILLKADESAEGPGWSDEAIRRALDVSLSTVVRVRERFVEAGLEPALERRKPQRVYQHRVDGECEAHLIALACSTPPDGRDRWTLRLLADKLAEDESLDGLSYETVRRVLKKTNLSLG